MGRSDSRSPLSSRLLVRAAIPPLRPLFVPRGGGRPPGAGELSVPVSPSGIAVEAAGSPRFLGSPDGHSPCSQTPVGPGALVWVQVTRTRHGPRLSRQRRLPTRDGFEARWHGL